MHQIQAAIEARRLIEERDMTAAMLRDRLVVDECAKRLQARLEAAVRERRFGL